MRPFAVSFLRQIGLKQTIFIMKKTIFGLLAVSTTLGFVACNNEGNETASADTTTTTTTTTATEGTGLNTNTNTSTVDYAAMADTFNTGNSQNRYLDARTGKPIRINVDRQTGRRTNAATGEPVWRYIDSKTWWIYGGEDWNPMGEARMEGSTLRYKGDNDQWMSYSDRWPNDDSMMSEWKSKNGNIKTEVEKDGDTKYKDGNLKIKTEKDGDIKIKTEDGKKIKKDEDGVKVKN